MSLNSMLRQRAKIERLAETVREDGTVINNWSTYREAVPCLIEKIEAEQIERIARVRGYFPEGTELRPDTVLGSPDRISVDGVYYLVTSTTRYNGISLGLLVAQLELLREL